MAKYLLTEKMGLEGEGLQCWNKLEDKLATKLSQLTRLLHHFSAYPPEAEASLANPEEVAAQHESEIHDILNETASRIRQFKSSLQIEAEDNRIEAMKAEHEAIQRSTQNDLKKAESIAKDLEEAKKEGERLLRETMEKQAESFAREVRLLRSELQAKADDLDKARFTSQQYCREMEELKKCHQLEMENEKEKEEKVRQDQQEHAKKLFSEHCRALQEMKARHGAEMEQLKLDGCVQLEKLSDECASREAVWQNEKLELQKRIDVAVKEKIECNLAAQNEFQERRRLLKTLEEALAKEKETTSKLQNDLNLAEEDTQSLKENIKAASINNDNLVIALGTMKQEASEARLAHDATISKWESAAVQLRQDLENVTNTCAANESDVKGYKTKVDELAFQLITTRKELSLSNMELDRFQTETQKLSLDIESKKEDIRRIQSDAEARNRTFTAEISRLQLESIAQKDSSAQKMKIIMEDRIQQQLQAHETHNQILQKSFISQLEEGRKARKSQLEALEASLLRQKEEKARAKRSCEEFAKALKAAEQKMDEQERKFLSQIRTHDTKVIALIEKLDSLENSGSNLEEEFESLSKQVLKHSKQSKEVGSVQQKVLKETEEKCRHLESALANLTREHAAGIEQHEEMVKCLKQAIADQERAHNDAVTKAFESYTMRIQQCMDDMQRSKDEHRFATEKLLEAHEMELAKLCSTTESQKNAEVVQERIRLQNRLQRNKLELNEEMELTRLEFEKTLSEQKDALEEMTKKHDRLLRSHLAVIKDQKEAAETEMKRCEQVHAKALASCTEKWTRELDKLEEDRAKQFDKLEQSHSQELQDVHATYRQKLSATEESWKQKLEITEKQWKWKLENDEVLWRIEQDSEIEEIRKSLLFSAAEEKTIMAQGQKMRIDKLENCIYELKTSIAQKDERTRRLLQDLASMDESHKILVLDLQMRHTVDLCELLEKQRIELSEVQKDGAALVEELQEKQKVELESSCMEMERVKVQMMEKQVGLEKKLEMLQERFVNRESRVEDVARISKLELTCEQKDVTITKLNDRTNQLQLELCNREENYNKIFGNNAPLILQQLKFILRADPTNRYEKGTSDWLKPKQKVDTAKVDSCKVTIERVDRNLKWDATKVAMLPKRSISASRNSPKPGESIGRSASTLI